MSSRVAFTTPHVFFGGGAVVTLIGDIVPVVDGVGMLVLVDAAAGGFCVDELLIGVIIRFGVDQLIDIDVVEREIEEVFPSVVLF